MSDQATVKGYTPEQMAPFNRHRDKGPVRAVGLTVWCKMQIVMGILLGLGAVLIGGCMLLAMATGVPA